MASFNAETLLTAEEVGARIGVKKSTILLWQRFGKIPSKKLSHKIIRFDLNAVLAALDTDAQATGGKSGGRE